MHPDPRPTHPLPSTLLLCASALWPFLCAGLTVPARSLGLETWTLIYIWLFASAASFPLFVIAWKRLAPTLAWVRATLHALPAYLIMSGIGCFWLFLLHLGQFFD
jgi:hypothetical protein